MCKRHTWIKWIQFSAVRHSCGNEYGNGNPVAFCFSNTSDTALYKHYFQCIKNVTGKITANVFMSDNELAFYNVWNAVIGTVEKQLLCT